MASKIVMKYSIIGCCFSLIFTFNLSSTFTNLRDHSDIKLIILQDSAKPYIAAIMGTCLGGGLEVQFQENFHGTIII